MISDTRLLSKPMRSVRNVSNSSVKFFMRESLSSLALVEQVLVNEISEVQLLVVAG